MNARLALQQARAVGLKLSVVNDNLELEADAPPPAEVLSNLANNKPGIVALLRPRRDGWSSEDWHTFYEEHAAIAEFDGGVPRDEAEAQAFEACVTEWRNRNPARSRPGHCVWCRAPECDEDPVLPFGLTVACAAWIHDRCWPNWQAERRRQAVAALADMGLIEKGVTHEP